MNEQVEVKVTINEKEYLNLADALFDYFISKLQDKAEAQRKISRAPELKDEIGIVGLYVKNVASMKENEVLIPEWNRHIDDCKGHKWFKPLEIYNSIRYRLADLRTKDLVIRPSFEGWDYKKLDSQEVVRIDYNRVLLAVTNIARAFKSTPDEYFCELQKKDVSLADVSDVLSFNWGVKYEGNPYIPVIVNNDISLLFGDNYLNVLVTEIVDDYFVNFEL